MLAYENVKTGILEYIKSNQLRPGDQLPTEKELSEYLDVGRLSLREGLNALKSEGIILSVRGKGTFVACSSDHIADTLNVNSSVTDMIRCSGYEPGCSYFDKRIIKADRPVAAALMVEEGIDVPLCTRVRTADGVPAVLTRDHFAPVLAAAFLGLTEGELSIYRYIESTCDIRIGVSTTEIVPECATAEIARTLEIAEGTPVLVLRATVTDIYGTPLLYAWECFRADKFRFVVTRGKP